MNLIGDPWIPVVYEDDSSGLVSLIGLYQQCTRIRDLSLTPPQRVAVMRLLICISQAGLDGPKDEEEWLACEERLAPASVDYLKSRYAQFELLGNSPFLQVADLEAKKLAPLDKLDVGLAAGNTSTLFDQEATPEGRTHTPAWTALNLLTFQNFSSGGRVGQANWGCERHSDRTTAAPCIQAAHAFVRGANLSETVFFNLLTKNFVDTLPNPAWGQPIWDAFPQSQADEAAIQNAKGTYLGRLVPLSRLVRVFANNGDPTAIAARCIIGPPPVPMRLEPLPAFREPSTTVIEGNEGYEYLKLSLDRHIWRELGGVVALSDSMQSGGPPAIRNARRASERLRDRHIDVWVGGLVAHLARYLDTVEWNLSIPLSMVEGVTLAQYGQGVQLAETAAGKLEQAVNRYLDDLSAYGGKDGRNTRGSIRGKATGLLWQRLDQEYGMLYTDDGNGERWWEIVESAMRDAYARSCPHETPRQIQAHTAGRSVLRLPRGNN